MDKYIQVHAIRIIAEKIFQTRQSARKPRIGGNIVSNNRVISQIFDNISIFKFLLKFPC